MVQALTRASRKASDARTSRALAKYRPVLALPEISTETIKALGYEKPHDVIKVLNRHRLLEKVRHVPQHWVYRAADIEETEQ